MSKVCLVARQVKISKLVKKFEKKRIELKNKNDYQALDKLPRLSSSVKIKRRCSITGRARGYIRTFGVSRIVFRSMALQGKIPGVRKTS